MNEPVESFRMPADVIFFPCDNGHFIASNIFTRSHVEVNPAAMTLLGFLHTRRSHCEIMDFSSKENIEARDATRFSNADGLLADPSNFLFRSEDNKALPFLTDISAILELFIVRHILIGDELEYRNFLARKENIFDNKHIGNFHQQLGHQLRLVRREDPDKWWASQKFEDGAARLKDNLYKHIQFNFYEEFFKLEDLKGKKVLDVGCGTGFYSRYFAKKGAAVVGIDPSDLYTGRAHGGENEGLDIRFQRMNIAEGTELETLPSDTFDLILFQDAFMFYFVPYGNKRLTTRKKVLTELKRALKPGGRFMVMEPHGVFWLQPWLGETDHPFTILTEYSNKIYGVTPTLSQLSEAFEEAGLLIQRIHEPRVAENARLSEPRGYFQSFEFPQWWVFILKKDG